MSDQGGSGPAAGWYPDPEVPGGQRYWDGTQWGEQRPPADDAGPADWQSPPTSPGAGQPPSWQSAPSAGQPAWSQNPAAGIDPWFWQSIVATVLCCLPLGIVGIVKASQAKSAIDVGNGQLAQKRAGEARTWTLISAGAGVLFYLIYFAAGIGSL